MSGKKNKHKKADRHVEPSRVTPGSAEGDLETVEQDLDLKEREQKIHVPQ
jgi:hypothetical protein